MFDGEVGEKWWKNFGESSLADELDEILLVNITAEGETSKTLGGSKRSFEQNDTTGRDGNGEAEGEVFESSEG